MFDRNTPSKMRLPTPWRLESRNVPIADTGDYDGVITILSSNGKTVAQFWNASDDEEETFRQIVEVINAHETEVTPHPPGCCDPKYRTAETSAEPDAWMAEDGRVCTADLKRSQKPIMTAGFTIPLYRRTAETTEKPACKCGRTWKAADCPVHGDPAALTGAARPPLAIGIDFASTADSTVYRCRHGNYFAQLGGAGAPTCGCFTEKASCSDDPHGDLPVEQA